MSFRVNRSAGRGIITDGDAQRDILIRQRAACGIPGDTLIIYSGRRFCYGGQSTATEYETE